MVAHRRVCISPEHAPGTRAPENQRDGYCPTRLLNWLAIGSHRWKSTLRKVVCRADFLRPLAHFLNMWRLVLLAVFRILNRNDFAGPSVLGQQIQRVAQYFVLQIAHVRPAQTVSDLETFRIKRARRAHLRGHFRTDGYQDRRDAVHFDFTLDRDDRAGTDTGSTTGKNDRLGARAFVDLVGNFPRSA